MKVKKNVAVYNGYGAAYLKNDLDRRLTNLLSTASAFRDRLSSTIQRQKLGLVSSVDLKVWLSEEYDASFAYRLLYNLRNYAQHESTPLSTTPLTAKREENRFDLDLKLAIKKDDLLGSSRIQASLRKELRDNTVSDFDVIPLCEEFVSTHYSIVKAIVSRYRNEISKFLEFVATERRKHNVSVNHILVVMEATVREERGFRNLSMKLRHFPEKEAEEIYKLI